MTIPLVSFCQSKQIELISLYPNATHIKQPLCIAFFHPFKEVWRKFLAKWKNESNKKILTREAFSIVLKLALDSYSQAKETIIGGFEAAGLMPFNPNAPDNNVLDKKKRKKSKNKETVHPAEEMEENKQISDDAPLDNKKRYLKIFEHDSPLELLQEFKENKDGGVWTGAIEQDGLFHYWLKIQNEANESTKRSVIKSVESLNYDKDKSIDSSDSSHEKQPVTLNDSSVLPVEVTNVASAQEKDETNLSSDGLSTVISGNIILRTTSEDEQADVLLLKLGGFLYPLDKVQFVQEIPIAHSTIDSDYQMDPAALQNITQAQYAEPELNVSNNNLNKDTTNLLKDSPCVDTCILKENCNHQALENTSQPNTDVDSISIETEARKENIKLKDANSNFEKSFLLPEIYLPKNKRAKLEKKGKPKLPDVGTGDAW